MKNGHENLSSTTTVVITDGPNAVRHFEFSRSHYGGHSGAVKVERVEKISDTIGAGDSFVAGYLSAQLKGKAVGDSIEEGVGIMTVLKDDIMDSSIHGYCNTNCDSQCTGWSATTFC